MSKTILVIDDDELLRSSLTYVLGRAGYEVRAVASAEDGLATAQQALPHLILLDIGLPGMDGLTALHAFKGMLDIPVFLVTAQNSEMEEASGLELGADDYITKPFDLNVLLARVKVALRRTDRSLPALTTTRLKVGDLTIDAGSRVVTLADKPVALPPRAFDLLYVLASVPGQVLSIETLLQRVWGVGYEGESQAVYVYIRWLREKLEEDPTHPRRLLTVRGVGYKLVP